MKNHEHKLYMDQLLKKGLEDYINHIPDYDTEKAWSDFKRRSTKKKASKYSVIAASIVIVLIFSSLLRPQATTAFRGFLRNLIVWSNNETVDLHQKNLDMQDFTPIQNVDDRPPQETTFDTLPKLLNTNIARFFLPDIKHEKYFRFARVLGEISNADQLMIEFYFDNTSIQLVQNWMYYQTSTVRAVDNEDYVIENIEKNERRITVFSHKSGFTILEWDYMNVEFEIRGLITKEDLLKCSQTLGLFD